MKQSLDSTAQDNEINFENKCSSPSVLRVCQPLARTHKECEIKHQVTHQVTHQAAQQQAKHLVKHAFTA